MLPPTRKRGATLAPDLPVAPEALFRLELLLGRRVLDLRAISEVVVSDAGLMAHLVQLLHHMDPTASAFPSVEECILELGMEGMRECLRNARLRRAN